MRSEYAMVRHWNDRKLPRGHKSEKSTAPKISRQKRERMKEDKEYLAMRDIYLEQNPACVNCGKPANQIHHIVKGTAGKARSLLNSDTWLAVCGTECHEAVDALPIAVQISLKQRGVSSTIERLRK